MVKESTRDSSKKKRKIAASTDTENETDVYKVILIYLISSVN